MTVGGANADREGKSINAKRGADLPTVAAMAAIVGVLSTQVHEGFGHGGACLVLGFHARASGAFYFYCALGESLSLAGRLVEIAGSTMNLLLAGMAARRRSKG